MKVSSPVAIAIIGTTLVVGSVYVYRGLYPPPPAYQAYAYDEEVIRQFKLSMGDTPAMAPGVRLPHTVPAAVAQLAEDAPVIGVRIDDTFRAYSVRAMSFMETHVVNDLLDQRAISVTYCDRVDCARVLTHPTDNELLTVGVGAWRKGEMNLRLNGRFYPQTSQEIPLDDLPFVKTTWKAWRTAHPETDVYSEYVPVEGTSAG